MLVRESSSWPSQSQSTQYEAGLGGILAVCNLNDRLLLYLTNILTN